MDFAMRKKWRKCLCLFAYIHGTIGLIWLCNYMHWKPQPCPPQRLLLGHSIASYVSTFIWVLFEHHFLYSLWHVDQVFKRLLLKHSRATQVIAFTWLFSNISYLLPLVCGYIAMSSHSVNIILLGIECRSNDDVLLLQHYSSKYICI